MDDFGIKYCPTNMKHEIWVCIRVDRPPAGVSMRMQRGRNELLAPTATGEGSISFEFPLTVDLSSGKPNFLGKYAQGPKDARFVYVNSGTLAGQTDSCWSRRAKISLMSVTAEQIEELLKAPGSKLETAFYGTGRDGGPTCASVKGIVWKVVKV